MTKSKTSSVIKIVLVTVVVLGIIGYALFNSRLFIEGPQIFIDNPQNGATLGDSALIKIQGRAFNIAYLRINDRQIYTDENSNFSESLLLEPGYNIIQLTAEDKFGRKISKRLELVYNGPVVGIPAESENSDSGMGTEIDAESESGVESGVGAEPATSTPPENEPTTTSLENI